MTSGILKKEAGSLLSKLHQIQEADGFIGPENIRKVARDLRMTEESVYAVVSYYPSFRLEKSQPEAHSVPIPAALAQSVKTSEGKIHFLSQKGCVLDRCGEIDPLKIDDYLSREGYVGLKKAQGLKPEEVIGMVKRSGLRGRAGAGFPAAVKWESARKTAATERYVICNAAEGDLGAFMDRALLESDPQSVIEGMAIVAHCMEATKGFVYIRAEYEALVPTVKEAIVQARRKGFIGTSFDIEAFLAAGMYVCGEETALINSMEGKTGRPRYKPPYPAECGLWGKPTIVNNVKTLAQVPLILRKGAEWYVAHGTSGSSGSAVLALSGHITNSGVLEVPMGTRLEDVIFKFGGGIPGGKKLKAIQTGGPLGGFLTAEQMNTPVTFEDFAKAGSPLGSGGLIVMDETTCMVAAARYFARLNQEASCGYCSPCRLGGHEIEILLEDICQGHATMTHLEKLKQISSMMQSASFCALGQGSPTSLISALTHFRTEFEEHVLEKRCRYGLCQMGSSK